MEGVVPVAWIHRAVIATELSVFRAETVPVVLPVDSGGGPDVKGMESSEYWRKASATWSQYRGGGASTPKTLWSRLDHYKRVSAQVGPSAWQRSKVVCNSAGEYLRAARVPARTIADNSLYFLLVETPEEAAYLTALLNSCSLQDIQRSLRESDRQCSARFWRAAPIPRFDSRSRVHIRLADACREAEVLIDSVVSHHGDSWCEWGQVKRSTLARDALVRAGTQETIDRLAEVAIARYRPTDYRRTGVSGQEVLTPPPVESLGSRVGIVSGDSVPLSGIMA